MSPFRPANLNKRAYPGNASVIGPTCTATVGFTTSNVGFTTTASCGACTGPTLCLGCRCDFCRCPCCCIVCACAETVCDRTVPSGRWKASEQYEARSRDAWGPDTCSCSAPNCLCCINVGFACTTNINDYKGFFICCGPSTSKWFVAPACTQVTRSWYNRSDAVTVANSCMGSCGWFVPSCAQLINPGSCCFNFWDSNCCSGFWSSTENIGYNAWHVYVPSASPGLGGPGDHIKKPANRPVRAFRCTAS